MIKYDWRTSLHADESAELAEMLGRAAAYDAEPEYTTIDYRDVERTMAQPDSGFHHLLIWMLPHATALGAPDHPERLAGLLRLTPVRDGVSEASIVIDPDLRSIGIVTLLLERIGLQTSPPDGLLGTRAQTVTAWARGNHPATGRISNRFLIPRTRRVWKLIRAVGSVDEISGAPVLEPVTGSSLQDLGWPGQDATGDGHALRQNGSVTGVVGLDLSPVRSEEFGSCATVQWMATAPHADRRTRRQLLDGAAATEQEAGLAGLIIHVDSDDAALVNACRLAGFQHDRTDVLLQLGGQP